MYTKFYTGHAYTEKVFIIYLELNLTGHPVFYLVTLLLRLWSHCCFYIHLGVALVPINLLFS